MGYGMILALVALNSWFWGLLVLLVLAGMAMSVSNISANTLLQATAPPYLRGQTVSLYMLAMRGGISVCACRVPASDFGGLVFSHANLHNRRNLQIGQLGSCV